MERAATTLGSRLAARQEYGCVALENAIELTRDLKRVSGFACCDILIAGYEQVLAELNAIGPMTPPSAESLNLLVSRIDLYGEFFALLARLAVFTGSLATRPRDGAEHAEAKAAPVTAPPRRPGFGNGQARNGTPDEAEFGEMSNRAAGGPPRRR
jgi:hypothetical protein